jgi:cell pole-organizing protein PopZ
MSALTSLSPADSVDERSTHEPSMEEILASIRRIISDDQSLAAHREPAQPEGEAAHAPEPSREPGPPLQPTVAADAKQDWQANSHLQEPLKAAAVGERKPYTSRPFTTGTPYTPPPPVAPLDRRPADFADMRLRRQISDDGMRPQAQPVSQPAAVEPMPVQPQSAPVKPAALHEEEPIASPATDAAVASSFNALFASRLLPNPEMLAELTRDLLRPMLKAWIDNNLPVMVERLVRAEIERVARGGGR